MMPRRWLCGLLGAATTAGVLLACTLTQSLGYLQQGDGEGGGPPVVTPEGGDEDSAAVGPGAPTVLVANQTRPKLLTHDAASLYWIADGKVLSVAKTGGTPKVLGVAPLAASQLAVDADPNGFVFMATGKDVIRLPKDGSGGGVIFAAGTPALAADTVAADDASLFVLQLDVNGTEGSRIVRMAKDGGGLVELVSDGGPATMTLDPANVVWLDLADPPLFHVQGKMAPAIEAMLINAGPIDSVPLASVDVAVDDNFIYWTADEGGGGAATLYRRDRQAAGTVATIGRGLADDSFAHIAIDDTHVYVLEVTKSSLVRAPKDGKGDAVRVLADLAAPSGLVVDANAIYMTLEATGSAGSVVKVAKTK